MQPSSVHQSGAVAVVCGGNKVGEDALVAAGEDDVPDDGVWMGGRDGVRGPGGVAWSLACLT